MDYTCPLCGEFKGTIPEVQAHISSKKDKPHKGKAGNSVLKGPERPQAGQETGSKGRPGKAQGKQGDLPPVECEKCGRPVKYPELMPHKKSCPDCGKRLSKMKLATQMEEQADEPGNDETKGVKKI